MWSDNFPDGGSGSLTPLQFKVMQAWKSGDFLSDWSGPPQPSLAITAAGLDRAALEPCVGGPLFPGIEASWFLRDRYAFTEPFRLDASQRTPGDVTKQMAVPWQSDFLDCAVEAANGPSDLVWWPAQRPIDVWLDPNGDPVSWARDGSGGTLDVKGLIDKGDQLGLILAQGTAFLETNRVLV
jgi:hypothetical protein